MNKIQGICETILENLKHKIRILEKKRVKLSWRNIWTIVAERFILKYKEKQSFKVSQPKQDEHKDNRM